MRSIINSTQIDEFFNSSRRDSQEILPHLIRKLIFATINSDSLVTFRIPVGDDIGRPGYDGKIETTKSTNFVPVGFSVWEMGTGNPEEKADGDYNKRTKNPGDVDTTITTFVFVTPHRWAGKESWIQEKLKQGIWKSIQVIDNIDLETWLEIAPVVSRWFARQVGIPVDSFRDIELFLDEFQTHYGGVSIPNELIIGGRDNDLTKLTNWFNSDEIEIFIKGQSDEEAAAFIAATINKLPNGQNQQISSKTLFVDEQSAIEFLATLRTQHFIVPLNHEAYKRAKSLRLHNIRLIIPLTSLEGHLTKSKDNVIKLGSINRRSCQEILTKIGIPTNKAERITLESKGSLPALLLLLGGWQDEVLPWLTGETSLELIPLMLAGQWSVENQNDHNAIEKLSNKTYKDIERTIAKWKTPNGPIIRRGQIWDWLAWDFAWDHLASELNQNQINQFVKTTKDILTITDPRFDLSADKRWMASVYDKVHPYTVALRSGLIGSIVQIAIHNDDVLNGSGQAIADSIVNSLLINHDNEFPINTWLSISSWLPDLAEASPDVFLTACEKLVKNKDAIEKIFEEGDVFFSHSEHTHLLWALERLAWSTEFLTRVTLVLGELSILDPGGKLANRPINSLKEIFLPWHPHTTGNVEQRLDSIDVLYKAKPNIAWKLACSLLPSDHGISSPTNEPIFRNWKKFNSTKITIGQYWIFIKELVTRMIQWAGNSGEKWASLIESYNTIRRQYPELGGKLFSSVMKLKPEKFTEEDKITLSEIIRNTVNRNRQFQNNEWSLEESDLSKFEELYNKFKTNDIIKQYTWLFNSWPEVPLSIDVSYEEKQKYIENKRLEVLNAIYKEKGIDGILLLAQNAQSPYQVGLFAAKIRINKTDEIHLLKQSLCVSIGNDEKICYLQIGQGFVWGRYQQDGNDWLKEITAKNDIGWDKNKYANLALGLPANQQTWDIMEKWDHDILPIYWKNVGTHSISPYDESAEYAITKILEADRPYAALQLATFSVRSTKRKEDTTTLPPELIIKLLEETPKHDPRDEKDVVINSMSYHISELLDILEAKGTDSSKLTELEWIWLPALEYSTRGPKALQQALNQEPNLFIEILKLIYRGKNEKPQNSSDEDKAKAEKAYKLLRQWKIIPGVIEQHKEEDKNNGDISFFKGEIDSEKMMAWINEARRLAVECDRLDYCDNQLGNVFAYSPCNLDKNWPNEVVCDLIENIASDDFEHGIEIGVYNKRGVHARAKGGTQERTLALKFNEFAKVVCSKYPRTAAMLTRIAKKYEREAKYFDERDAFEEFE